MIIKKLIIGLILFSVLYLSSSCASINEETLSTSSTLATQLDSSIIEIDEIDVKIYTHEEIEEIMNEQQIQPYHIVYEANAETIKDTTFVDESILLTPEYKYGRAFYSNYSSKDATLIITNFVPETDINKTIPANKGLGIIWQNNTDSKQTYTVSVSNDGSENLSGKISVGKSNIKDELE